MACTIKDIASLADVSIATASRVFNGKSGVKASTRKKVLQVAKDLNYLPNQLAKSMITRRTNTIGLVIADITNPFYSDTAKIIEMRARKNDYTVIVGNTDNKNSIQKTIIDNLKQKRVDGFIFASVRLRDNAVSELIQAGFHCMLYHRRLHNNQGHFIGCDNYKGIQLAMEHLYHLGHKRIAFISGSRQFSTGMERLDAYLTLSKKLHLKIDSSIIKEGGYERKKTSRSMGEILSLPEPPTAILAANDLMALQVLDCILKAGYRVPEDFSVVGFDDIPIAAHSCIQLTTVDLQAKKCAGLAIDNLLNVIAGVRSDTAPMRILLEPILHIRKTTAPPGKK